MLIKAVYFDIGETLLDRRREYAAHAARLGVSPHTFSAVFGAVIASGGTVADVMARFDGGPPAPASGSLTEVEERDLYPDVRPCLTRLRRRGMRVGIVGNQPADIGEQLRRLGLPADEIATSVQWGVAKPDPEFFQRIIESAGLEPASIVYVGDQIDLDIVPALAAGLHAVRLLRGPWGYLVRDASAEDACLAVIGSLGELPALLGAGQKRPDELRAGHVSPY
jgi:FMN phosphatase YigB (HAD superfamily)